MIRLAITAAAFDAIAATLPLGSVAFEAAGEDRGLRYIWLEHRWLDRLKSYRGPGESYHHSKTKSANRTIRWVEVMKLL